MDNSAWALIFTMGIDMFLFSIEFIVFSVYRKYRSRPLSFDDASLKTAPFSESDTALKTLLGIVWTIPLSDIHYYCGLEGQLYLTFHKVMAIGFSVMAIVGCLILIPIYALGTSDINDGMNYISMAHIIQQEYMMSSVLIFFMLFSIISMLIVVAYIKEVSEVYANQSELNCTIDRYTVEVRGLPNINTSTLTKSLLTFMNQKYPEHVKNVYVVPNIAGAYRAHLALTEHSQLLRKYQEYAEFNHERLKIRPKLYKEKVDAIDFCKAEIEKEESEYGKCLQEGINDSCGVAFMLCKTPLCAYNIVETFRGQKDELNSEKWTVNIAPAPGEINWHNMCDQKPMLLIFRLLLMFFFVIFFFLLITPVTSLQVVTYILEFVGVGTIVQYLFGQLLPSLILLLYLSFIVRQTVYAIVRREEWLNKSEETVSAMVKYLIIMVTYIFIVPLLGIQVISMITSVIEIDYEKWQSRFVNNAAFAGLFFTILVIHFSFLKNGSDLLQIPKLLRVKLRQAKALNEMDKLKAFEAYEFRWAYEYGISITAFFIVMAFSVAYPLILLAGALFYTMRFFSAKYNLLCFYHSVPSTTGNSIPRLITSALLVGIFVFQVFTCFLILLNPTPFFIGISIGLLVFSTTIFGVIYSKKFQIEKDLKRGFKIERMEEEGMIMNAHIERYHHPLQAEITQGNILNMQEAD